MNNDVKNCILLIKLGQLGDLIQATHCFIELGNRGFKVKLLTSDAWEGCIPCPGILCRIPKAYVKQGSEEESDDLLPEKLKLWTQQSSFQARLGDCEECSIIVDLDGHPASMVLTEKLGGGKRTIGWVDRRDWTQRQTVRELIKTAYSESQCFQDVLKTHGVDRYRSLLIQAKLLEEGAYEWPKKLFNYPEPSCPKDNRWIALHAITSKSGKNWQPERFGELVGRLYKQYLSETPTDIFLFGNTFSSEEKKAVAKLAAELNQIHKLKIHDLLAEGKTYAEQAGLLQRCDYFIGGDSSWGHMAAALGIKTFTVFGEKFNPISYRPKPSSGENEILPEQGETIEHISVDRVFDRIRSLPPDLALT